MKLISSLVIGLVAALIFMNFYFRIKIIKVYKKLVNANVEFQLQHIISTEKLESEIIPRYPKYRDEIYTFVKSIRFSLLMAVVLIVIITILGLAYNTLS